MNDSIRIVTAMLLMILTSSIVANDNPHTKSFWKYRIPSDLQGECNSLDPMGMLAGAQIKANCSIRWVSDDGKLYCFSSVTSLSFFLDKPRTNLREVREACMQLNRDGQYSRGSTQPGGP